VEENFDSLWMYEPQPRYGGGYFTITTSSNTHRLTTNEYVEHSPYSEFMDHMITTKLKKEKSPVPAAKTKQQEIDDAVREAIEKPKREAEIARRVAAVEKIAENTHEVGTVLRWKRKLGKGNHNYVYAAIKAGDDKWYVTGSQMVSTNGWTWEVLVEWMTTGEHLVTDLEVSGEWTSVL